MKPTIGRIVIYNTTEADRDRMILPTHPYPTVIGNKQKQLPAIITAVWNDTCVNLRVFEDGHQFTWKTSVIQGDEEGQWNWPVIQK